jgi:predicted dinucleotide-utilizing enzyme
MTDAATAMRVGIIGGGTIARLFLEHIQCGDLGDAKVVAIFGRNDRSRGKPLAAEFEVPFVTDLDALVAERPDVVVEAASHERCRNTPRRCSGGDSHHRAVGRSAR